MMRDRILYIGLSGLAGSGKDTVAKALSVMLDNDFNSFEEFKSYYDTVYGYPVNMKFATFEKSVPDKRCICIAFADQLKEICSSMFGIPVERFYYNKANSWICINKDFSYTEIKPADSSIVTAEEYYGMYSRYSNSSEPCYISLRELLVYVGTYVLQQSINKNIFVNTVNNKIKRRASSDSNILYAIVTDVRFTHELDFIKQHNGILIRINRESVKPLDNIAEHDLDSSYDYDYVIENNSTYTDLFKQIWDLVHGDVIFKNETIDLPTKEQVDNYLRLIDRDDEYEHYKVVAEHGTVSERRDNGQIISINMIGGPMINVCEKIPGTDITPVCIELDQLGYGFVLACPVKNDTTSKD